MAAYDNPYSRYVAWMKVLLPLGALALLSTMFLFARPPAPRDADIPYADIEALAREQRMSDPSFTGVAEDGSLIAIAAQSARPLPGSPESLAATHLVAEIDSPDGTRVEIRAGEGAIDAAAGLARLTGLARVTTSTGYEMETRALTADLDSGRVESEGALEIRAPFGDLTAGAMVIETPGNGAGRRMFFTDGVRLVYRPAPPDRGP